MHFETEAKERFMTRLMMIALVATTVAAAACNRPNQDVDDARTNAEPAADTRAQDAEDLDRRLAELERKWQDVQTRVSNEAAAATATARARIEDDLMMAREALGELRTTTAENWLERQERQLERMAERVEQDVRTVARNWTPSRDTDEVGTTGDQSDWAQRRDALVARTERRVREMETALAELDPRDADQPDVESTRARVQHMKEDTDRLRRASDAEWWDLTKERLNAYLERLDAAIDRLAESRT
jgi:hypothetical protein